MIKCIGLMLALLLAGCVTTEPKVESTKEWEGHYYSPNEVVEKAQSMQLEDGESIWMMSNHTLNRLLKNAGK